ncbi:RNA polymerase sigma factor [Brevibacillus laterosporus]|uniref:RNA polymerase sigma factor n=1 Tax=Brevibacillus laterosporus TaxID=1465 RepID=UPI003D24FD48
MKENKNYRLLVNCVTEHKEDFYRLAYSYVKNKEDALDIIQESIKKALISIKKVKEPNTIKSWFYKIVIHTAINFLRKQKKLILSDDQQLDFLSSGKEDSYADMDLHNDLDELPIQYKTVIILRFFEDLKINEIAEIIETNSNTVKTRLYTALKRLRIKITEEEII